MSEEELQEFFSWQRSKSFEDEPGKNIKEWEPEVAPEEVEGAIKVIEPEFVDKKDLSGQKDYEKTSSRSTESEKQESSGKESKEHCPKEIGDWGEKYVFAYLQKEYANAANFEIFWLNKDGNTGQGYDFTVCEDGKEFEYIEVKSKTDESKQFFEITGTQWEFARQLYNRQEGEKYKIYVVDNAGKKNAVIKILSNPVRLWKEGRLYAHPVNIHL